MSSDLAISVRGISKAYIIPHANERHETLAETFLHRLRDPFRKAARETFWALKDISFEVNKGEIIGVIGRNGAGKSTLLKILSRITEPTSGEIDLYGRIGSLLEVGTGFHPELTGRENIYLNGQILGMRRKEIDRHFDAIVDFAEIEKFLDTPVKRYSSGMYVRLAFAVAAHLNPDILIIDEVLAVGDAQFQKKCLGKIGDVAEKGRTVLFVSHNMTAVASLCRRVILLESGRVVANGSAGEVIGEFVNSGQGLLQPERNWKRGDGGPGNSKISLLSARVRSRIDISNSPLTVTTPLVFDFEYWNNVPRACLNLSIFLYGMDGTCIFNVGSPSKESPGGTIRTRCLIPGNLLNDGIYRLTLLVVDSESNVLLRAGEVASFEIHDVGRSSAWVDKWPGAVRPDLEWVTEFEPASVFEGAKAEMIP